jgi:DNA-binding transcriptional ArsR family regulator
MNRSSEEIKQAVQIYKALGEPTRFQIALLLAESTNMCCGDIGAKLGSVPYSTLSHHLKQLTDCGLLDFTKDGTYIYYGLNRKVAERFAPELLS